MSRSIETFGKYLLLEKLASGGMAEVFLAKSNGASGIGKFVAIKRILPQYSENAEFIEMFKEEAKIAVNLNHGNVVSIFDFGVEKNQFYLVMEYVEGQNLRQVLNHMKKETKDFSIDQVVYMIKEVAAGLDHAHRCLDGATGRPLNITHRDMSPQNIMISFEGEVKVVDFGIAKAETQVEHTRAGTIKGKFGYMSPEQADGQPVDQRTDVFSLGIVLWELLTNERLFTAQSEAGTLRKIRECQIPSLRKINPNISAELDRICNKALAKDKSLRYQTAAAYHRDLNRFLNTQYPEFSPHDFSVYMKSVYSIMFLENRKKLADYAKMSVTTPDEKTSVTATATLTNTENSDFEGDAAESLDINPQVGGRVDLSSMRMSEKPVNAPKASQIFQVTQNGYRTSPPTGTQSQVTIVKNDSWLGYVVVFIALVFGGYYYSQIYRPSKAAIAEATKKEAVDPEALETASKQSVQLNIQSHPQQAIIYIDDVSVGMTPYLGQIEMSKPFKLTVRKEGFLPYEVLNAKASQSGYSIVASLQPEPPMGYVAIEILNGGTNTIISVNGVTLSDKDPVNRYPIPANIPIVIKATNPFTNTMAEQVVTVGQAQKKAIKLILSRQADSH